MEKCLKLPLQHLNVPVENESHPSEHLLAELPLTAAGLLSSANESE